MTNEELLEKINKRFEALEQGQQRVEKRLKRQIKKTEDVIVRHFDTRVGEQEKRIRSIEEPLELPHTN